MQLTVSPPDSGEENALQIAGIAHQVSPSPASISTVIEPECFECPDIECGAVFSYMRASCGHFVLPKFCPTCGGLMVNEDQDSDNGLRLPTGAILPNLSCEPHYIHLAAYGAPSLDVPVRYADEASRVFAAYREKSDLGASDMNARCGIIYDAQNRIVARISYNGRIWDTEGNLVL